MRLIAIGHKALTDGFALLGFETFPNANVETVENILSELLVSEEKALVFLEDSLAHPAVENTSSPKQTQAESALLRARRGAARIIITEIPPLHSPETYRPLVEDLVNRVLGPKILDFKE